jgi:phosphatidylglycerophosphate synthase
VRAALYLPDSGSARLADQVVAGRPLALRPIVAAARAGLAPVGVPSALRTPALERAIARVRDLRDAVAWLGPGGPALPSEGSLVLLPAPAIVDARDLRALAAAGRDRAVLAASAGAGAPVVLLPAKDVSPRAEALAAGQPLGAEIRQLASGPGVARVVGAHPWMAIAEDGDLTRAEARLYAAIGTDIDTGVDRFLHRRGSRVLTRGLVRTPVTPNQVSLVSLAIGLAAIWCAWRATPLSAMAGVVLYLLACIVDHSDGEVARLTFQESRFGAHLDWLIDTIIHAGLVLAMGVSSGGRVMAAVGAVGAAGVTLSALFARWLPREIAIGEAVGGALRDMGNRDLFYVLLLAFVVLRWLAPAALPALAVFVALGSQSYWIACAGHIRAARRAARA